jgi:toxin ParE1/3/4
LAQVRISQQAQRQLRAISTFIMLDNPRRAVTFVRELRERCRNLADFPMAGPIVRRIERRDVRRIVHGRHSIFYLLEADMIEVIAVAAGAMDLDGVLPPQSGTEPPD